MSAPLTKPGRYGTLYRYRIMYRGTEDDPGQLDQTVALLGVQPGARRREVLRLRRR